MSLVHWIRADDKAGPVRVRCDGSRNRGSTAIQDARLLLGVLAKELALAEGVLVHFLPFI